MRKIFTYLNLTLLAFMISVGMVKAEEGSNGASIKSELTHAKVGQKIVFAIKTKKGNTNYDAVRIHTQFIAEEGVPLDDWKFESYSEEGKKWVNIPVGAITEGYTYPQNTSLPLIDGESYFSITPATEGNFSFKLTVLDTKANTEEAKSGTGSETIGTEVFSAECPLTVSSQNEQPYATIGDTQYASVYTALMFAEERDIINLSAGEFKLERGTDEFEGQAGWYLPIDKNNVTIQGTLNGQQKKTILSSDESSANTNWSTQNFITVFSNNVTIKDMVIISKKETNKAIEILGKDFTLDNVQIGVLSNSFGGSVYFNPSNEGDNFGTFKIYNSLLCNSRITYTGAKTGTTNIKNVSIIYENMVVDANSMSENQLYTPISAKEGLTFEVEGFDVNLKPVADKKYYHLDANTVSYLPKNTKLVLEAGGTYGSETDLMNMPISQPGVVVTSSDENGEKPKVYGTFDILAEGCQILGLDLYTKSTEKKYKNIIDVVAGSVIIKNNNFTAINNDASAQLANGICIWPTTNSSDNYIIEDNTFNNFNGYVKENETITSTSTAFMVTEGFSSGFSDKGTSVVLDGKKDEYFATENDYVNCITDYNRACWTAEEGYSNAANSAPYYKYTSITSCEDEYKEFTLNEAANYSINGAVVNIAGTYELTKILNITKAITLKGAGIDKTIIKASESWETQTQSYNNNLITLSGLSDVTSGELTAENSIAISDLTIQDSKRHGLNIFQAPARITNVKLKNNATAGMVVQSKVEAFGLVTEGNGWGAVNVDKASSNHTPVFTFDEKCIFNEDNKVWSEIRNGNPSTVNAPAGWNTFDLDGKRFWTNEKVAADSEVNVTYSVKQSEAATDKASIKVKYDAKPAMAYNVLPKGKEIEIIVEPLVGYSLQSVTSVNVNGGDALTATPEGSYTYKYTVPSDETSVITIAAVVSTQQNSSSPEGTVAITETVSEVASTPTVLAKSTDFNVSEGEHVAIVSEKEEESEIELYIKDINDKYNTSISSSNVVAYNITPVVIKDNKVEKIAEVSADSEVTLAFPYPTGYNKSDLESVTVYHFADNGDIEELTTNKKDNYIEVTSVTSFSPFVLTYTVAEPPVVITYHDLHITESVGAKLVSRNGKDRTPDGGSFTLSLEKEEGYEDCEPTVYYKRGRFGDWNELKLDEVSGYYQIRSVYTDIYVKVSGDGIWPVSNEEVEAQEVKVYTQNGAIVVSTPSMMDVQIISMTGAQVAADKVAGQREFRNLSEGIYVVRVGEEIVKVRL